MPECLVRGVRSIDLVATNFEEAARFYETVWNLDAGRVGRDARIFSRHRRPITTSLGLLSRPQPAVVRIVFDVADRRRGRHAAPGGRRRRPRRSRAPAALAAPAAATASAARIPTAAISPSCAIAPTIADVAGPARPPAPDRARQSQRARFRRQPAFFTNDARLSRRSTRTRRCGSCIAPAPSTPRSCSPRPIMPTLNHVAFEMPDFDSVMRGMGRMKDNGYPIEWGPGRHGPGNNVFAYFCGPDELPIEYTGRSAADRRQLRAARLRLLEIPARPFRPLGHHAAALGALLPRPAAVRLHRRRLPRLPRTSPRKGRSRASRARWSYSHSLATDPDRPRWLGICALRAGRGDGIRYRGTKPRSAVAPIGC